MYTRQVCRCTVAPQGYFICGVNKGLNLESRQINFAINDSQTSTISPLIHSSKQQPQRVYLHHLQLPQLVNLYQDHGLKKFRVFWMLARKWALSKTFRWITSYIQVPIVQYVATPKTTKPVAQRVSGARILTSLERIAILLERGTKKEKRRVRKKKQDRERKERDSLKLSREQKKSRRENETGWEESKGESKKWCTPKQQPQAQQRKLK